MADKKISQLSVAASLTGAEAVPLVQSGSTLQATVYQIQSAPMSVLNANTVLFLNGSKVPTSNSGLTFDGTSLTSTGYIKAGTGAGSPGQRLMANMPNGSSVGLQLLQDGQESWVMEIPASSTALRWTASGVEYMRLTYTGLALAGGNAPTQKLNLYASGSTPQYMAAGNSNTGLNGTYFGVDASGNGVMNTTGAFGNIFSTNGSERGRFDSSGNFGINTTAFGASNLQGFSVEPYIGGVIANVGHNGSAANGDAYINFRRNGTILGYIWQYSSLGIGINSAGDLHFSTAGTDRAIVDASGNLLVAQTSQGPANSNSQCLGAGNTGGLDLNHVSGTASGTMYERYNYNATTIGSVTQSGTAAVLFNTTSDRRLKQNIVPAPSASDVIDAIQIVSHDWKAAPDEHVTYGVIAQDLHAVAPQAVSVGDDGDDIEKVWGVDYSKLVPMLIKEVQSLRARVAQLEQGTKA